MASKKLISKKNQTNLLKGFLIVVLVFIALVILVPLLPVAETVLGVELTAWQQIHAWFVTARTFMTDYAMLIAIVLAIVYGVHRITKK